MPTTVSSVPALFALAHGRRCEGPHRCAFCAAACGESRAAADYLRETFTARDTLARPHSPWVCEGCALAMTASAGQLPEGKPWMWSWVVTADRADRHALCAMLGGDRVRDGRAALRAACLDPPGAPCALVLCPAGRTHTLYRAALHRGGPAAVLTLDGRPVRYTPPGLAGRVALCARVAVAFGAKVARELKPIPAGRWSVAVTADLESWHALLGDPLTAAAACLFDDPLKEEATSE